MKNVIKLKHVIFLFIAASGIALLNSCVVYKPYSFTPVTVPDIIKMSNDKVPALDIINEIKKSHTAYTLKASEYVKLQQAGVADTVVNYMQKTHLDLIRNNQQAQDSYYMTPGYGGYWYGGYWYGGLGYGWPYYGYGGWGLYPNIIIRGGGGNFHGGSIHRGGRSR